MIASRSGHHSDNSNNSISVVENKYHDSGSWSWRNMRHRKPFHCKYCKYSTKHRSNRKTFKTMIIPSLILIVVIISLYFVLLLSYMYSTNNAKIEEQKLFFETIPALMRKTMPQIQNQRHILAQSSNDADSASNPNPNQKKNTSLPVISFPSNAKLARTRKLRQRNYKVIATVFGGRRDRMFLLHIYISQLLNLGHIDEYHIWDCTLNPPQNENEHENENHMNGDSLWLQKESLRLINTRYFAPDTNEREKQWFSYYKYYYSLSLSHQPQQSRDEYEYEYEYEHERTRERGFADDDIMLKIDDDIVFIDIAQFPEFIEFVHKHRHKFWLFFPNIVNNGVSAFFQEFSDLLLGNHCGEFEYPAEGYAGTLVETAEKALCLHTFAVQQQKMLGLRLNQTFPINERFSINFFATKLANYQPMWQYLLDVGYEFGDEKTFTTYAHKRKFKKSVWFGNMVVAHGTFGPQKEIIPKVVDLYRTLALDGNNTTQTQMTQQ